MPKPLTAFQLISNIKKLIPRGNKRGSGIINHLVNTGYIYQNGNKFLLCHGVHPTLKDVEILAKQIDPKHATTFSQRLINK